MPPAHATKIAAPNDFAFGKLGEWGSYSDAVKKATLKYHVSPSWFSTSAIEKGDSIWIPTTLNDKNFTTIKGGQRLILTKQPGGEVVLTSGFATRGTIVVENLALDNGNVQVIDSVMRVPETLESTARIAYKDLTSFIGALYATDLMSEMSNMTDLTIFAPSNAAFQKLAGTFEKMDKDKLKTILKYHIVPGNLTHVWELKNGANLTSAQDRGQVHIRRHNNYIYVNSAEIIQTDILISNGIVHMIGDVLNPDRSDAKPTVDTTQVPAFTQVGATSTGETVPTPFATNLPCTESCPVSGTSGGAPGPTGTSGEGQGGGSSSSNAAVVPRCTGLAGAGVGLGLAVGAIMVGL